MVETEEAEAEEDKGVYFLLLAAAVEVQPVQHLDNQLLRQEEVQEQQEQQGNQQQQHKVVQAAVLGLAEVAPEERGLHGEVAVAVRVVMVVQLLQQLM